MAKKISGFIKLQIPAGKANPSPPVGPALGQKGVNIMEFCKQFNAKTSDKDGLIIPVVITVYSDKSFTFIKKTPPASAVHTIYSFVFKHVSRNTTPPSAYANKYKRLLQIFKF